MNLSEVKTIGSGLQRPEGIMTADDDTILTADARGRCSRISRDGTTAFFGSVGGLPNGICLDRNGNCIIANIGNGQVQSLSPEGSHEVLLIEADSKKINAPNFPFIDSRERMWVSNSTFRKNVEKSLTKPTPDGCIVLMEDGSARIVAEGIYFANGITLDQKEEYLYVAETMKRDILRFKIGDDGTLHGREVYGPKFLGRLGFPDGIAFDEAGNLWVTFPMQNAVGYITPQGDLEIVLEDPKASILKHPTNICFGWEDRKTAFIGSLDGSEIPYFTVPYPGMKLIHQKGS